LTTEEQVAAVRAQVEREREGMKPEAWWQAQAQEKGVEKKSRVVRFAGGEGRSSAAASARRSSAQGGKRRSVVMVGGSGKGSSRRD
jgi:hypothetical protein